MHYLGAHTVDNGGIHMAAKRAAGAGMTALQIFTAVPTFYNEKMSVRPERVERFRKAIAEAGLRREHIMSHAAYVLSVEFGYGKAVSYALPQVGLRGIVAGV